MGFRNDLERRIDRTKAEIAELLKQAAMKESYLAGLQEAYKLAPRDSAPVDNPQQAFRKGSSTAKAYAALRRHGRPLHVKALLEMIGKAPTRNNYSSLSSSLNAYAKRGEFFTKPEPNTFGLTEFTESGDSLESAPLLAEGRTM